MRGEFDLTTLLNKAQALCEAIGNLRMLASDIGEHPARISEWISQRSREPSGQATLRIYEWVVAKTLAVAMASNQTQQRYRTAFDRISKEHPGDGKNI